MDRIIRQITDRLVSQLPDGENYYRLQNLDSYGFPLFLIRRIDIELKWNLDESMILPKTDWANTQSEAVQQSWQQFLNAIHAEVQLPASYARAVIETAVADVVEILIQPRKNIPEILFGGEEKISAGELTERTELLVVYPHFARVLNSYMQRKGHDELERARCKEIIEHVDIKITSKYTPLQWAQMLDPLFALAGKTIDTNIFRLFFEDKNRSRTARTFDLMNDTITRADFIEVLSSPNLLNYEGYEPDQSELFSGEKQDKTNKPVGKENSVGHIPEIKEPQDFHQPEEEKADVAAEKVDIKEDKKKQGSVKIEEIEDDLARDTDEPKSTYQAENEPPSIIEENDTSDVDDPSFSLNENFTGDESEIADQQDQKEMESEEDAIIEEEEFPESEQGESPIWQRFLSDDEEELDKIDEPLYDDEYLDEPIIDLTDQDDNQETKEELEQLLNNERLYYVDEIFGGSERAYEESLQGIAQQHNWKSASKHIEKNIFKRNMVNIYSEPAVDFTDRLQTYFLNKKNSE